MTYGDRDKLAPMNQHSAARAKTWKLATRSLSFSQMPILMGIVNVTPDSFSDGGRYLDHHAAVDHGLQMVEQGAGILDVGGESTRPYSTPVCEDDELRRVIPVIRSLCEQTQVPVSVDTSKARVAREAMSAGAEIINDITGLEQDPAMLPVAMETNSGVCAMHMQGTPQIMQDNPSYDDVVTEIEGYLRGRRDALISAGIDSERICLDPGIGFGKSHEHNLTLLANCHRFHSLGQPLLVGHSRKGFIGKVLGDKDADRTAGSTGVALALASQGVQILRVHDISPVRDGLLLYLAAGGVNCTDWSTPD
jgi:dihydropteroate synthase